MYFNKTKNTTRPMKCFGSVVSCKKLSFNDFRIICVLEQIRSKKRAYFGE